MRRSLARGGFSLVETLIATMVAMIIGGTVVSMLIYLTKLTATQNRNMLNQQTIRDITQFMGEEILAMGSGSIEPYISEATATALTYVGDLDNDNSPDRVNYDYDGDAQQLSRTLYSTADGGQTWTAVSTDVLVEGLTSFGFAYFGENNSIPATADDITSVEISMRLDPAASTTAWTRGRVGRQEIMTRVTIRNRLL